MIIQRPGANVSREQSPSSIWRLARVKRQSHDYTRSVCIIRRQHHHHHNIHPMCTLYTIVSSEHIIRVYARRKGKSPIEWRPTRRQATKRKHPYGHTHGGCIGNRPVPIAVYPTKSTPQWKMSNYLALQGTSSKGNNIMWWSCRRIVDSHLYINEWMSECRGHVFASMQNKNKKKKQNNVKERIWACVCR